MRGIPFALIALAFLLVPASAEAQTLRIAYLNSQEVMSAAPGSAEAQAQFDREMQGYQAEIEQLEEELRVWSSSTSSSSSRCLRKHVRTASSRFRPASSSTSSVGRSFRSRPLAAVPSSSSP
jgi:hypothetical protein